ncbi:MAG TPA: hypothetical protein VF026_12580, partial [Ktedonobacteraceae bacterium]
MLVLGEFLLAQTGGQPFALLETLKVLQERQWLVPRPGTDGRWRLELEVERVATLSQERTRRELIPAAVRTMILARLAKLSAVGYQLVVASAVVGHGASAQSLWQVAQLGVRAGMQALEEALGCGMLREEEGGEDQSGSYQCAQELIREVVY